MNKKKKWIITAIVLVVFCLILGLFNLLCSVSGIG